MAGKSRPKAQWGGDQSSESSDDGCDIVVDLDLEGVRRDGLGGLSKGDRLTLRLDLVRGYQSIVCVRADGIIVGAIGNFPRHSALLNCLRRQVPYVVVVTEVRSGACHIYGQRADR